jgi:sialate O-acetylesterase
MALPMKEAEDGKAAMVTARHPMLRLYKRPATSRQPMRWVACTPDEVGDFSTVAYFFGKHLHEKLDVPVGLIVRAVGGTTIQRWVSPGSEKRDEVLAAFSVVAGRRKDEFKRFEAERDRYDKRNPPPPETAKWLAEMARLSYYRYPTGGLYRRWIRPVQPFAVRGVIWYQGEFNNRPGQAHDYRHWQPVLIEGWRKDWGQENLPFLFVQMQVLGNATTPLLRESQTKTLEQCSQTAMAVICDESAGLHPPSKRIVGERLGMAALSLVYDAGFPPGGPRLKRMEIVSGKAVLTFEHVGRGLQCKTDVVTGFFMCGKDRTFRLAQARITGPEQLTVWCDEIETPTAVRYAWLCDPRSVMSLYNSAGLPASPFRTDAHVDTAPLDRLLPEAQLARSSRKKGRAKLPGKIKKTEGRQRTGADNDHRKP